MHALSTPLVTKSDGTKFGKSEGGTVWLDPSLTSPYAFFQFWLNADDADARTWLPLFSERPADELEALIAESIERPAARTAQRALAEELTLLVHGPERARARPRPPAGRCSAGTTWPRWGRRPSAPRSAEAGSVTVDGEVPTVAQLLQLTGLVGSLSEARRTVKEGGAYLNNERVTDADAVPGRGRLAGRWLAGAAPREAVDRGGPADGAAGV